MAAGKNEEKVVEEKVTNVIDVFWGGFLNNIKIFQSLQNRVEEKSLEAFEGQLELIETTLEQLIKFEEESKKLAAEWKANIQEVLTGYGVQNLTEWTDKFEEALAFSPSKKTFESLQSQAQLESALKEVIGQRQKNSAEALDAIGEYVDQLKQTQSNVLETLKLNNPLLVK